MPIQYLCLVALANQTLNLALANQTLNLALANQTLNLALANQTLNLALANQALNSMTVGSLPSPRCLVHTQWYNVPKQQSRVPGGHW